MAVTNASIHRLLVNALASSIAWEQGEVVQADGFGALPAPPDLNGTRPDLIAKGDDGSIIIGEAKAYGSAGPSVDMADSLRTYRAWADGEPGQVRLAISVPAGLGGKARKAAHTAGWTDDDLNVVEVTLDG
jgi:hypothetical protein